MRRSPGAAPLGPFGGIQYGGWSQNRRGSGIWKLTPRAPRTPATFGCCTHALTCPVVARVRLRGLTFMLDSALRECGESRGASAQRASFRLSTLRPVRIWRSARCASSRPLRRNTPSAVKGPLRSPVIPPTKGTGPSCPAACDAALRRSTPRRRPRCTRPRAGTRAWPGRRR